MMQSDLNILQHFSKLRVLLVGDFMLDQYWHGDTSRVSPEAPVPVVHVTQAETRPGGAGNVALNLRALGAAVTVIGTIGQDADGDELISHLKGAGITCMMQQTINAPTIKKLRVLSRHQQLIRLDFENSLRDIHHEKLLADFKQALTHCDIVILSDYGKGTLAHATEFIDLAREHHLPVFVDPKSLNFSDYAHATLITPNLKEFESIVGHCEHENDLVERGKKLITTHHFDALLVTRGEKGMTLIELNHSELHIPSLAKEVYDVTGAGDTVIATLALGFAAGLTLADAVFLANTAAGIVVGKMGAATVSVPELQAALSNTKEISCGVINEEQLLLAVKEARACGEKIVMTNGCFDILHAGHVHYLNQAKALGARLIVAVNDDQSVERLKGVGRPINSLEKRMTVLAGLASVDWVVPFSEDTPKRLICSVLPDILVKGGDYKPHEIAGHDCVTAHGGMVKVLDFVPGLSTSNVIKKIHEEKGATQ